MPPAASCSPTTKRRSSRRSAAPCATRATTSSPTPSAPRGAAAAGRALVRPARHRLPDAGAHRPRGDPRAGRRRRPKASGPQIVMMTAHGSVESAVEALKLGARDYLQKPFEVDELLVIGAARRSRSSALRTGLRYLLSERDAEFNHYGIVGRSRAMLDVIARAELVAESKSTVLITGETGTGKELVARAIHARSAQRDMPLIKVNCAAIPETLLESELFGHVRGAFTGATFTKKGRFALADGGTIFLDEIGTHQPGGAGQAAARAAGARVRAARRRAHAEGRRARHRRDQPRPAADGRRRQVPGGSLLPPQRHPDRRCRRCASGARTSRCSSSTSCDASPRAAASASTASTTTAMDELRALRLARQRARAREHDRARRRARDRAASSRATRSG